MQITVETTTQSASLFSASFSNAGQEGSRPGLKSNADGPAKPTPLSVLEAASKKAEEDAVVIAALQQAVEKGKGEDEEESRDRALATVEDYQKTAGKLQAALGEDERGPSASVAYESASISTTTMAASADAMPSRLPSANSSRL